MPALNPAEISAIDTAHIWHPYSTIGAEALPAVVATEAHGIMLTLIHEGRPVQVIDAMSSWWTAVHGHGHPVQAPAPCAPALSAEGAACSAGRTAPMCHPFVSFAE